ncbi:hypothetical protein [Yoonia maritima]|uniref:hypothetical protein n=1 Tax=Yoonia maritima TaxID=1435347 RepID=UPI003735DFC4
MAGIGHNSGRVDEPGHSWRKHVWTKARKKLMPTLPIEVVRLRVRRAEQLGLPYKTYAGIRASTGHDLIGFLFSSNALHVLRDGQAMPAAQVAKLDSLISTHRVGLAHTPVTPTHLSSLAQIDRAHSAPRFAGSWADMRDHMKAVIQSEQVPADRFVLIGDTGFEREWSEAAQLAGYLPADIYFEGQVG